MVLQSRCILGESTFWAALEVEGRRGRSVSFFGHVQREDERQAPVELDVVFLRDPVKEIAAGDGKKREILGPPPLLGLPPCGCATLSGFAPPIRWIFHQDNAPCRKVDI